MKKLVKRLVAGLAVVFAVGFVVILVALSLSRPGFDDDDPRLGTLVAQIGLAAEKFAGKEIEPISLDFDSLNGGNWSTACVFNPYSHPADEMIKRGATVDEADGKRLNRLRKGLFRITEVEETEAMVTYIDPSNRAQFLHLRHGLGQFADDYGYCVSKPETVVQVR